MCGVELYFTYFISSYETTVIFYKAQSHFSNYYVYDTAYRSSYFCV